MGLLAHGLLGALVIVALRLPQLTGENRLLDGDEAVVGLMALDILDGRGASLFFAGQAYGLTILESSVGALMFGLFGVEDVHLRLGMLAIWILSWFVWLVPFCRMGRPWIAWLVVFCPAWSFWAMAARGGYVTAILLFSVAVSICLSLPWIRNRNLVLFVLGVSLGLVAHAQALWFVAVIPLVAFSLLPMASASRVAYVALGFAVAFLPLELSKPASGALSHALRFFPALEAPPSVRSLAFHFYSMMSGSFFLWTRPEHGLIVVAAVAVWSLAVPACFIHAIWSIKVGRPSRIAIGCAAGILGVLVVNVLQGPSARYMLPVSSLVLAYLTASLSEAPLTARAQRWVSGSIVLMCVLGALSIVSTGLASRTEGYWYKAPLSTEVNEELLDFLKREGVEGVFGTFDMHQWAIGFYGYGDLNTRSPSANQRFEWQGERVDSAYRAGRKTALVIYEGATPEGVSLRDFAERSGEEFTVHRVHEGLAVVVDPSPPLLGYFDFRFD